MTTRPRKSEIGEYDEETDTYYDPEGWYEALAHQPLCRLKNLCFAP